MIKTILTLTTSALILAGSAIAASRDQNPGASEAQARPGKMMQQQDDDMTRPGMQRSEPDDDDRYERWGMPGGFYGPGGTDWRQGGMMGPRMGGEYVMRMMMILFDTDGDGALSLEEVQAVHARFFKAIDADSNGKVTLEEIQAFMSPMGGQAPRQ